MLRAWSLGGAQPLAAEGGLRGGHGPGAGPWSGLSWPMWDCRHVSVAAQPAGPFPAGVKGRIWGNLAGGAGFFYLLYCLLPGSLLPYLGIFGGIGVGLSATLWLAGGV